MARLNQQKTAKAKAIAAKENSQAVTMHALLITTTVLGGLLLASKLFS
ncbi:MULTISPECIES: hypothetical protein [unclassified Lentilitoribacter]|jgi:hypothetical protein|nr:hypothetical protein [Lentilitoribacter sp. Alg239-R112]